MMMLAVAIVVCLLSVWVPASAQTVFVETFDGGSNEGGWTYGVPGESVPPTGGNPDAYLYAPLVDTFAPQPRTTFGVDSLFTGDYRGRGVTKVGIDLITYDVDFSAGGRPLTVMLYSDNSTPADFSDDWAAYRIGPDNIPLVGEGWRSYDFEVPSQETALPAGWAFLQFGPGSPPSPDWNAVISKVSQLIFFYGDPELFFIFQQWELGLDNPRITTASAASDPGRVPPNVTLERLSPTDVRVTWSPSVCSGASDYAIYEGQIGDFTSHAPIDCSDDGGDGSEVITLPPGDRYLLVVPLDAGREGSYGLDSSGAERPSALSTCRTAQALGCP
jgi:hypothetical protein